MALKGVQHGENHMFIILEYAGARSLFRFIKSLPETDLAIAQTCMKQISAGVAYIHQEGVAHRDMKPENIVVMEHSGEDWASSVNLKIVDFGCAEKARKVCSDFSGAVPFIAPEIILAESHNPAVGDIWACGVVLLELTCGIGCVARMLQWTSLPPVSATLARQLLMFFGDPRKLQSSLEAHFGIFDEELLDLIFGLLHVSPPQRLTASEAANCRWLARAVSEKPTRV